MGVILALHIFLTILNRQLAGCYFICYVVSGEFIEIAD